MKRLRGKLTYANVIATMALFLALGGVSYAAMKLPRNSVGPRQLKKGAVTPAKLASGSRKALTGPAGAPGPQGPVGPKGERGAAATALLAHVSATGKLLQGSGVTRAAEVEKAYEVDFNRDVSRCNFQLTFDRSDSLPTIGLADPAEGDPTGVVVETIGTGSSPSNTGFTPRAFYLAVFCP